jgi:hypothetical protein
VRGSDLIKLYRSFPKKEIEISFFTLLIMTTYLAGKIGLILKKRPMAVAVTVVH